MMSYDIEEFEEWLSIILILIALAAILIGIFMVMPLGWALICMGVIWIYIAIHTVPRCKL